MDSPVDKLRQALNGEHEKERLRKNQEAWQYAKAHEPQLKQLMLVFGSMIWSAELKLK
jgi:hypothetical protein